MNCPYCQQEISEQTRFCPNCGQSVNTYNAGYTQQGYPTPPAAGYSGQMPSTQSNWFAIAGFVLSFFIPILGLIFSIIGLNKVKTTNKGKGLSTAGIVISIVSIVIAIFTFAVLYDLLLEIINDPEYYYY